MLIVSIRVEATVTFLPNSPVKQVHNDLCKVTDNLVKPEKDLVHKLDKGHETCESCSVLEKGKRAEL